MNRRQYLKSVSTVSLLGTAAVSGCLGVSGSESPPADENRSQGTFDLDRVDHPPHDPERPDDPGDTDDAWDEHYLGEGMAAEPTLSFEKRSHLNIVEPALPSPVDFEGAAVYKARIITNEADAESTFTESDELDVDFGEKSVIVIESGYGSSSVQHAWKRVEAIDDEVDQVHLHGYYVQPNVQTGDVASRYSVIIVDDPMDIEVAHVSLTVRDDARVNFSSDEGTVSVEEDEF